MIRFFIYFIISFTILSIPINHKKLFLHLDEMARPVTKHVVKRVQAVGQKTFGEVKIWGIKILDQSKERVKRQDQVRSQMAAPRRPLVKLKHREEADDQQNYETKAEVLGVEYYSQDELKKLQEMLKDSEY